MRRADIILRCANRSIVSAAIVLAALATGFAPVFSESRSVDITYVANEGFLITAGSDKVLIDALFSEGFGTYLTPSRSARGKLKKASPPFDGVDLILVTHAHGDHVDARMVLAHLANNPGATCVAPQQAVDKMKELDNFDALVTQVEAVTPERGKVISKPIGGIELEVYGMRHAPYLENGVDRHRDVQNLGYLVTVGGVRVFHAGDAVFDLDDAFIASTGIGDGRIDVLFIKSYDLSENTQHLVNEVFKPALVVGMHAPPADVEKMADVFSRAFPRGFVFKKSMEKKTVVIERGDGATN